MHHRESFVCLHVHCAFMSCPEGFIAPNLKEYDATHARAESDTDTDSDSD